MYCIMYSIIHGMTERGTRFAARWEVRDGEMNDQTDSTSSK